MKDLTNMPKIYTTGNRGFIGTYLGYPGSDKEINILGSLDFTGIDYVIHCAAEVGRIHGEEEPYKMLETNVLGTLNVVKECIRSGAKLINFSTSEVSFPLTNVYGISKDCAEKIVEHYSKHGLKAISVRPSMVYGAGVKATKYKSALDQWVWAVNHEEPYEVHKDTIRGWLHIKDLVRAINIIIEKHDFNKYEVYQIGSEDYRTMESIAEQLGGKYSIIEAPIILTKVKKTDFSKIMFLGWKPTIKLEEGLEELKQWHK